MRKNFKNAKKYFFIVCQKETIKKQFEIDFATRIICA